MPRARNSSAKPNSRSPKKQRAVASRAKTQAKRSTGRPRMRNGIPLKRKIMWVYDTASPEFKARVEAEIREIKERDAERDGIEFVEAALADSEAQKWWR